MPRRPTGLTPRYLSAYYLFMSDIDARALDRELKRGAAELLILSLLEARPRHGYDLSKLIEARSDGQLKFHIDSLYPLLYRLEERAWIKGTWVEKPDERRRRFYKLTPEGRRTIVPAILTCSGTNCPKVLLNCAAAGCSWNNVGPLP